MTPAERAERVAELVDAALERGPHEWTAYLEEACRDDPPLMAEVKSLLGYQDKAAHFIEAPAYQTNPELLLLTDEPNELRPGEFLRGYKILSLLGEGGMGEVYLAEDAELGRKVAIKLVKRGFGRENLLRQFRQEERILGALNHPNIARLYGGAVSSEGTPYFLMEYVEGDPLASYCELHQSTLIERLQLFRKICSAVSYAHQHLVIHRDLKPGNIRVTPEGEPKLLDFGIAKLLDESSELPDQTVTLAGVMTPEYASPEQVRGERMTTASDVYSLGVVLYQLLTGEKPYRLTSRRPDEIARAITEHAPVRPSAVLSENPNSKVQIRKSIRGDLDNIVMLAMRKEPERRYASVAQFSEDIRRHLDGLPVIARKDTWGYRSSKFVRRNRLAVGAAALILLTLVGGIIATSRQARIARLERAKAERRFNDVRKLANSYLFELHDAIENLPGSTSARALLVKRALEYLQSLTVDMQDDPSLQREVIMAYLKVGNVQGNPRNANLGDSAGALQSYEKARAIAENLAAVSADPLLRRPLALIYEKMADVKAERKQVDEAVQDARKSLTIFRELAAVNPTDTAAQLSVAISQLKVGDILGNPNFVNAGDQSGAMESYQVTRAILENLHTADASNSRVRRFLGMIHERLGTMSELRNDSAGALAEYQKSAEMRVPLAAEYPNDSTVLRDAAIAYEKIGNALAGQGDLEAALENRSKSLAIFRSLLQADPKNVEAQESLAISHIHLADLLGGPEPPNLDRTAQALENYREAVLILEGIASGTSAIQDELAEARGKIARLAGR